MKTVDLRQPHLWYPVARATKRRVVYHAGPTNSGKTYNALRAMKSAASGVYCGPLRLLAMEVFDSCNVEGTYCNLVTGALARVATTDSCGCESHGFGLETTIMGRFYASHGSRANDRRFCELWL